MPQYSPRALGGSVLNWAISRTQYSVFIGGIQYLAIAGTMNVQLAIGRRSTAQFSVYVPDIVTHFFQYAPVAIYDQSQTLIFSGYITQVIEQKPGFASALVHQIQATDQHFLADKRVYAASYLNKTPAYIVNDILTNVLSQEGVTAGQILDIGGLAPSTSLAPSTTLAPQSSAVTVSALYNWLQISQFLDDLVQKASAGGEPFYWAIDQYKKLYFAPYTANVNTNVIDGTWVDQVNNNAQVTRQNPKYRNTQYLWGGSVNIDIPNTVDTGKGDGQTYVFTLSHYVSGTTLPVMKVNGVVQSLGAKQEKGFAWYYQVGTNTIQQDQSATALGTSDTWEFDYTALQPVLPKQWDNGKIAAQKAIDGTSGIIEVIESDSSINTLASANAEAAALVTLYGQQAVQLQLSTMVPGYFPGQLVTVNLPWHNLVNQQMLVESVQAQDSVDNLNIWYTINLIQGPYDTTWVDFFKSLIFPQQQIGSITVTSGSTQPVNQPGTTSATFTGSFTTSSAFTGTVSTVSGGGGGTSGGTPTGGTVKLKLYKFGDDCNTSTLSDKSWVAGTNLLVYWADISKSADSYDFSYIENALQPWASAGKKAIIRVSVAGHKSWRPPVSQQGTPDWVFNLGVTKITSGGDQSIKPQYWNVAFQTKMQAMINKLASQYDGDSRIEAFQIAVGDGGECKTDSAKYSSKLSVMQKAGYTDALWRTFINNVMSWYVTAFTKTQLIMQTDTDMIGGTVTGAEAITINQIVTYAPKIWIQKDNFTTKQSVSATLASAWKKTFAVQEQLSPIAGYSADSCHSAQSANGDTLKAELDIVSGATSANNYASSGIFLVFDKDLANSSNTATFEQYI